MIDDPVEFENAYKLCEDVLDLVWQAAAIAMAAMWLHIVWIHHSIGKRLDKVTEKLMNDG